MATLCFPILASSNVACTDMWGANIPHMFSNIHLRCTWHIIVVMSSVKWCRWRDVNNMPHHGSVDTVPMSSSCREMTPSLWFPLGDVATCVSFCECHVTGMHAMHRVLWQTVFIAGAPSCALVPQYKNQRRRCYCHLSACVSWVSHSNLQHQQSQ